MCSDHSRARNHPPEFPYRSVRESPEGCRLQHHRKLVARRFGRHRRRGARARLFTDGTKRFIDRHVSPGEKQKPAPSVRRETDTDTAARKTRA
jgi:hypothetical protein